MATVVQDCSRLATAVVASVIIRGTVINWPVGPVGRRQKTNAASISRSITIGSLAIAHKVGISFSVLGQLWRENLRPTYIGQGASISAKI